MRNKSKKFKSYKPERLNSIELFPITPQGLKGIIEEAIRRKRIEKRAKLKKTETELEREARQADNLLWFMDAIVKHRYPKAKSWQQEILLHAERGLLGRYTYEQAKVDYYCITNEWRD